MQETANAPLTWYSELANEEIAIDSFHEVASNASQEEMEAIPIPEEIERAFPIHGLDCENPYENAKRVIAELNTGFSIEDLMWAMSWVQSDGGLEVELVPAAKKALKEFEEVRELGRRQMEQGESQTTVRAD